MARDRENKLVTYRKKDTKELLTQLDELKKELASIRVMKASGGSATKLLRIKVDFYEVQTVVAGDCM